MIRWHSLIYDIDRGHGKDIRAKSPTCVITTYHSLAIQFVFCFVKYHCILSRCIRKGGFIYTYHYLTQGNDINQRYLISDRTRPKKNSSKMQTDVVSKNIDTTNRNPQAITATVFSTTFSSHTSTPFKKENQKIKHPDHSPQQPPPPQNPPSSSSCRPSQDTSQSPPSRHSTRPGCDSGSPYLRES